MTIDATFWVAISFFIFFGVLIYLKVPQKINNLLTDEINKMKKFQNLKNQELVAASDAFFPFVDGIEKLVQAGVTAVIQPSGSIRDKEIIKFANQTGTILVFSKTRHFKH